MSWKIKVSSFGEVEQHESDLETIGEAVSEALIELGFDGNDEGSYTIQVDAA